ncbi:YjhG/YagF family D-xylonate dehydratase [Planctomicrobium piriforme]|uniref:Putative dehydratase, YjhG/YagF family n=1 Tax=Planctomicrobium piriforme TaxID=1576369 RepID=A0A1I3J9R2_9PLAN|nr:YjhG/YagF family D-xylonate dehydratase [Planctomicrobium piriforme]SFI57004.1 putative dehydratase, YjhG/YagF family [Planctomicrobium piriforme]
MPISSRSTPLFVPAIPDVYEIATHGAGPAGSLPISESMLLDSPSGDLFGLTQAAGMGWDPQQLLRDQVLILSTMGGIRAEDGHPIALGYHTGHWEVGLLMRAAAEELNRLECLPFAGYVSDPCDGRSQGTTAMMDSLAYRNDAAVVLKRLIRSLPLRKGVIGVATCDKGLPAMMMALAAQHALPCVIVPGGVTLPPTAGEDAGKVQSIGARFAHGEIDLRHAADMGCRACGSPGGGCQFLGTAATAQVVGEALGLSLPHTALAPSGQPVWTEAAVRSAQAVVEMMRAKKSIRDILTPDALHNAMVVHAAFGGSTNLLLHIPAIAFEAGLKRPTVDDWNHINRLTPRIVDVLPNGPVGHPTVRVFLAGGVPEVMLHLRALNLLRLEALTASGHVLGDVLDAWEKSERRQRFRELLKSHDKIDPDTVIFSPEQARARGLTSTVTFPVGNIAPEGSVIKSTAIDPSVIDADGIYRKRGPARVFTTERAAIAAVKGREGKQIQPGDILVLICRGPLGSGMEETYQITSALKYLPWGKQVAVITDARFSGVSTGACIGHVGPEALAGGPVGKLRDGDLIEIEIDCHALTGRINFIGTAENIISPEAGAAILAARTPSVPLHSDPQLPSETRLWALLQQLGGGTWGGCVYDTDAVEAALTRGLSATPAH